MTTNHTAALVEALKQIDARTQGKSNAATNIKTIWAVRKIARDALALFHREN